jgi:hypothetical protein
MKYFIIFILILIPISVGASPDSDGDGLGDDEEQGIYFTDWQNSDTDDDGFSDGDEINKHFSPHSANKTLSQTDYDKDGLSDWQELQFATSLNNADTDNDGFSDYNEIQNSFDPLNIKPIKLNQKVIINTKLQTLTVTLSDIPLAVFPVSTGRKGYQTPTGEFEINNKVPRAWSKTYGLWMPYWMSFIGNKFGIHELPEWPGGYKEGQNHLGTPVSHGCVRLGVGPAAWLYNRVEIGTKVIVE